MTRVRAVAVRTLVAAALALAGAAALEGHAAAEENKVAFHFEVGPLFTLSEPGNLSPSQQAGIAGVHLGLAFEYSVHDRLGLEIIYAPDQVFGKFGGQAILQQRVGLGIRVRPWFSSGYLYPRPADDDEPLTARRLLSDVWIDLHGGIAFATETTVMVDAGAGTRVAVIWPLQVGIYARYQQLFPFTGALNGSWAQLSAGAEISLGFYSMHPDPDADDDGVPDARDRCPGTKDGTTVNAAGCPQERVTTPPPRCLRQRPRRRLRRQRQLPRDPAQDGGRQARLPARGRGDRAHALIENAPRSRSAPSRTCPAAQCRALRAARLTLQMVRDTRGPPFRALASGGPLLHDHRPAPRRRRARPAPH